MIYKQTAIIIKLTDFHEADKIATLLGKNRGRIETIAKGTRKPTSRKSSSIDVGVLAEFRLAKGKNFDIITEIRPLRSPERIKSSIEKISALYYLLDLCNRFFRDENQGQEIFDELNDSIEILEESENILRLVHIFEIKILSLSGFLKNDKGKAKMNKQQKRIYKIAKFVQENTIKDSMKLKLDKKDLQTLSSYLYNQVVDVLERDLKSYKFFKKVNNESKS